MITGYQQSMQQQALHSGAIRPSSFKFLFIYFYIYQWYPILIKSINDRLTLGNQKDTPIGYQGTSVGSKQSDIGKPIAR